MSLYANTVPQYRKMLANLDNWLTEAVTTLTERGDDPVDLLTASLHPDQFDLTRNIQAACDTFKLAGARLAGVDAPSHADGPATLDELRTRIAEVRDFLDGLDAQTIDASGDTLLAPGFLRGRRVRADEYVRSFATPNGYFHLCMVYGILRHNGVPLGKMTYIGSMQTLPPADG